MLAFIFSRKQQSDDSAYFAGQGARTPLDSLLPWPRRAATLVSFARPINDHTCHPRQRFDLAH